MASNSHQLSVVKTVTLSFTLVLVILLCNPNAVTSIPTTEFNAMLSILRSRGYSLFPNAISTSALKIDLLSSSLNTSFTLFAPNDSSLFTLGMTQPAPFYITTLRYHIVPRRFSILELRGIPDGSFIPTLLRSRELRVTRRRDSISDVFSVGGVDIAFPGLFYGQHVAVHGLSGILSFRPQVVVGSSSFVHDQVRVNGPDRFLAKIDQDSTENSMVEAKIRRNFAALARETQPLGVRDGYSPAESPENFGCFFPDDATCSALQTPDNLDTDQIQPPEDENPEANSPSVIESIVDSEFESVLTSGTRVSLLEICDSHGKAKNKISCQVSKERNNAVDRSAI